MKWDPSEFGGLKQIHMGSQEIWRPDILLYNNADPTLRQPYGNAHFVVESDGTILWVPPAHLEGFCKLVQCGASGCERGFVKCFQRVPQAVGLYCSCRAAKASKGNFQKTFYETLFTNLHPRLYDRLP